MTRKLPYIAIQGIGSGQFCLGCGGPTIEDKDKPFPTVGSDLPLARVNVNANLAFSLCLPCLDLLGLEIKTALKREKQMYRPVKPAPKPPEVAPTPEPPGPADFLFESPEEPPAAVIEQPPPANRPGELAIGTRVYTKDAGHPSTDWTPNSLKLRRFGVMGTVIAVHQQPHLYYSVQHDDRGLSQVGFASTVAFYVHDELGELGSKSRLAIGTRVRVRSLGPGRIVSFGRMPNGDDIYGVEFDAGGLAGFGPQELEVLTP